MRVVEQRTDDLEIERLSQRSFLRVLKDLAIEREALCELWDVVALSDQGLELRDRVGRWRAVEIEGRQVDLGGSNEGNGSRSWSWRGTMMISAMEGLVCALRLCSSLRESHHSDRSTRGSLESQLQRQSCRSRRTDGWATSRSVSPLMILVHGRRVVGPSTNRGDLCIGAVIEQALDAVGVSQASSSMQGSVSVFVLLVDVGYLWEWTQDNRPLTDRGRSDVNAWL